MTNEEQLKIYAAYLPYGLEIQHLWEKAKHTPETTLRSWVKILSPLDLGCFFPNRKDSFDWKPVLYPLDYLTKEIEHDGEKIIPVEFVFGKNHNIREVKDVFIINKNGYSFRSTALSFNQVNKLLELHFNVFNLNEFEYINKATLKTK